MGALTRILRTTAVLASVGAFLTSAEPASAQGRGRLDRSWVTPPRAALTFSVLLRPDVPDQRWPWLPQDFDWRFYLEAPSDQQLKEGFWRGDERIDVHNLHPSCARLMVK